MIMMIARSKESLSIHDKSQTDLLFFPPGRELPKCSE